MPRSRTHADIYIDDEFDYWVGRRELMPPERVLFARHLDPDGRLLEAGCGGGRVLDALRHAGFADLHGFDFVPGFASATRRLVPGAGVAVAAAPHLPYGDEVFDQVVAVGQIVCFLERPEDRTAFVADLHRIMRPGGILLISALGYDSHRSGARAFARRAYRLYRRGLRALRRSSLTDQYEARLSHVWDALLDRGPHSYWYRPDEFYDLVRNAGFEVIAIGSRDHVERNTMVTSPEHLGRTAGLLHVVARRV